MLLFFISKIMELLYIKSSISLFLSILKILSLTYSCSSRVFTIWIILTLPEGVESLGMENFYCLLYFSRLLLYMNSALNPILYNVISSKFRSSVLRLLRCSGVRGRLLTRQTTKGTTTSSTATTSGSVKKDCLLTHQQSGKHVQVTISSNSNWGASGRNSKAQQV